MIKDFKELSWNVTEAEYRADPAFSTSQIGSYQRDGIEVVFKSSPSLLAGSVLDTLCTDFYNFENVYSICDVSMPTADTKPIATELIDMGIPFSELSNTTIYEVARRNDYGASNWKEETVAKKIKESLSEYVDAMIEATKTNKEVISSKMYNDALECKDILTEKFPDLFGESLVLEDHEKVYNQLKFKVRLFIDSNPVYLRGMLDKIKVDYLNKIITPIDLKTKWEKEEQFIDSFFKWRYVYQSGIYRYLLTETIKQDEYFKDFTIAPFEFVVISNKTRRPFKFTVEEANLFNNADYVYKGEVIPSWTSVLYDMYMTKAAGNEYKLIENNGFMTINLKEYSKV